MPVSAIIHVFAQQVRRLCRWLAVAPERTGSEMAITARPKILVVLKPSLYQVLCSSAADQALRQMGDMGFRGLETDLASEELARLLPGVDLLVGGWGTPRFSPTVLDAADRLRLYVHTAGSVKGILPPAVFERGITVTHGAGAIATAVADMAVCLIWMLLRQPHRLDRAIRSGKSWAECRSTSTGLTSTGLGRELSGQRVGVLGAGHTGRCFVKLVQALGCEAWVYDPYLSDDRAAELRVHKVGLDHLLSGCPIVSCHLPSTDETHHLIGARELSLLQDGAILTNTARSWVMDQNALLAELRSGRIQAALDVFDEEPLSPESPFLGLDNVVLTPHVAGGTVEARYRQGQYMLEEIQRFLAGEALKYGVTKDMLAVMA